MCVWSRGAGVHISKGRKHERERSGTHSLVRARALSVSLSLVCVCEEEERQYIFQNVRARSRSLSLVCGVEEGEYIFQKAAVVQPVDDVFALLVCFPCTRRGVKSTEHVLAQDTSIFSDKRGGCNL